ncbi:MAG TPA: zinc-binding dehydrogenase [Alphaproteobacteria bacterium]|nr:zinc-binding dehydrogenase [Alphaproteobacteria bacterium]
MSRTGGPEVLDHVELPDPVAQDGEVLVRMEAVGIAKPDFLMRSGKYRWMPPLPVIPGNEMSGRIEALGPGVTGYAVGQPVLVWGYEQGCYTELGAYGLHRIVALPEGVSFEAAVSIPNFVVAWAMLHEVAGGPRPQSVYVNGAAGGVGTAVIQLAKAAGIAVIAGASSAEKCAFAAANGADHTIDYGSQDVVARLAELTGGAGVSLFLDQLVGADFARNLDALAPLGTIVSFNALAGLPEQELFAAMRGHLGKSPAVRCFSLHCYDDDPAALEPIMAAVLELLAGGAVAAPVHAALPLGQARRAHEMLDAREIMGKLVLTP